MIYKEAKIGNVKNITLIELGNGDVQIGAIASNEGGYTGVEFMNDTPNPIGTPHNTAGCTTDNTRPEAVIIFTKIESIEVLEKALHKAKVYLRNINK